LVLTFDPALGLIRHSLAAGGWREQKIFGRQIVCVAPEVVHDGRWDREGEAIEVYLETRFVQRLPEKNVTAVFARESLTDADNDPVIWELAGTIFFLCAEESPDASLITAIGALIGKRLFLWHSEPDIQVSVQKLSNEQRRRMDDYIQTHMAERFGVPQLARAVSLSSPHFTALCKRTTGKPPMAYVWERRLLKAHEMARGSNHRRREIARLCGFFDASHLNRKFKKFFKHPLALLLKGVESSSRARKS
jgi:AraC-like DNA-binding protein